MTSLEAVQSTLALHYSARAIEERLLAGIRSAGLNPDRRLSPEELGPLDQFHTGGMQASVELLAAAGLQTTDRVLDIGAGLAGAARLIASTVGCQVDCVEMSADYCTGAELLNRLTGLQDRVTVHRGSALELPFPDASFDAVWMQNVGMNIADKPNLYREIARVLKPGGRYAFQEMTSGTAPTVYFPLPWATRPSDQFLTSAKELRALLARLGFLEELFEDTSDLHMSRSTATVAAGPGQLGLGIFVDDLPQKVANARRTMEEGRVRLVRGVFRTR